MKEFKKRKFQKKKMFDVQQLLIGLNDLIAKKRGKKKRKIEKFRNEIVGNLKNKISRKSMDTKRKIGERERKKELQHINYDYNITFDRLKQFNS